HPTSRRLWPDPRGVLWQENASTYAGGGHGARSTRVPDRDRGHRCRLADRTQIGPGGDRTNYDAAAPEVLTGRPGRWRRYSRWRRGGLEVARIDPERADFSHPGRESLS